MVYLELFHKKNKKSLKARDWHLACPFEFIDNTPAFIANSMTYRITHMAEDCQIDLLHEQDEPIIGEIIRRNIVSFSDSDSILPATFRRVNNLKTVYSQEGCRLFVAKQKNQPVGCAGLGPLHGLPLTEGIGEIRDLVVEESHRGLGLGSKLLHRCLLEAKKIRYKRLYLETSPQMVHARKLFLRTGFRPVGDKGELNSPLPCYFLMEDVDSKDF